VVRNHPSNTLVREYWRVVEEGRRPRVLGVLASQLPAKPRPFDRLRQNLRKLCHSLQARLLLPSGAGLGALEAALHHDRITLHSHAMSSPEEALAGALQQHLLGLWDVLHEFGLNHFGRLVQFLPAPGAPAGGPAPGAGGTPGTPAAPLAAGEAPGAATPLPPRPPPAASPLSGDGSPGGAGSPATPAGGASAGPGAVQAVGGATSAAAAAADQPDPFQHDWAQVELQVGPAGGVRGHLACCCHQRAPLGSGSHLCSALLQPWCMPMCGTAPLPPNTTSKEKTQQPQPSFAALALPQPQSPSPPSPSSPPPYPKCRLCTACGTATRCPAGGSMCARRTPWLS
jgi:hypothetical protein